ncbi:Transcriptional regulator, AbiEi antitoxin, Type IV TA system [Raineyella antarctica]|uniref:Transcriptional regulator, AbiEi antitoxin, Type IV TA system n=1 Tax=Raineyella antarctica TaxID=1577474 RepID=A0A1G6IRT0_9ACTN|nr:type IV toxin-antitoxin system AbiEi family antitoxin domain-containing protein [Raineyella antarctica]SDC09151.1 Transcriptional regulator, AbiEi antitoxin, Type IV TA system [Raineyella antarctica]
MARVARLAAGQWEMLTTAQAEREGITRVQLSRLADAGVLERVDRGIYTLASSPDDHRRLRAAWLSLDPVHTVEERLADPVAAGVVSFASAAGLHQLGDLLDDQPEFTLPGRKQSRRNMRIHRLALAADDVQLVEGLPTTTVERTIADLLRDGHDPDLVAQIVGQALRRGALDQERLAAHLQPLAHAHGQPDGPALVAHLLDVAGLSPGQIAAELVKSPIGASIFAQGQAAAIGEILASIGASLPPYDTTLAAVRAAVGPLADTFARTHAMSASSIGPMMDAVRVVSAAAKSASAADQFAPALAAQAAFSSAASLQKAVHDGLPAVLSPELTKASTSAIQAITASLEPAWKAAVASRPVLSLATELEDL